MLKTIWEKYIDLAFPLKLLIGSFIGVLAGPGLIGFLSEYATYTYALRLGIRPPLEGIPYLKTAVTAASLLLTIGVVLIFIATRSLASYLAEQLVRQLDKIIGMTDIFIDYINKFAHGSFSLKKIVHREMVNSIKDLSPKVAIPLTIIISTFFGAFAFFLGLIRDNSDSLITGIILGIYVFVALITAWSKKSIWWVSSLFALVFYISSFTFLFNVSYYSSFLRIVGYGGGSQIDVYFDNTQKYSVGKYNLLLRTTEALICLDSTSETITEIPLGKVHKISYKLGSNYDKLMFRLPKLVQ